MAGERRGRRPARQRALAECANTAYRSGAEFKAVIDALGNWGQRWSVRVDPHNLDADFLMWHLHHRLALDRLPEHRVVVHSPSAAYPANGAVRTFLAHARAPGGRALSHGSRARSGPVRRGRSACVHAVWLGDAPLAAAMRERAIKLAGPRKLFRRFRLAAAQPLRGRASALRYSAS